MIKAILGMLMGGAMIFAASPDAVAQQKSSGTIRVASFGGIADEIVMKYAAAIFTLKTGMKVEMVNGNARDHMSKLIASRGREAPFDVVFLDDDVQVQAIAAGVLTKLTEAEVPNLKYVYDELKNKDGYGAAWDMFSCGIVYNKEKFKQAGIPPLTSWADLWNPKLAGRVAIPTIDTTMGHALLVAAEHLAGGDESTPEKGIAKIAEIKAHSYPGSSSTITTLLASGDVWVVPWLNGRAWGMIDKGAPLEYVLPKEGAYRGTTTVDVPVGAPNREAALKFVNEMLSPLFGLGMVHEFPYGPSNKLLAPILEAYPEISKKFPATPKDLHELHEINWPVFNKMMPRAMDLWNRQISTK